MRNALSSQSPYPAEVDDGKGVMVIGGGVRVGNSVDRVWGTEVSEGEGVGE